MHTDSHVGIERFWRDMHRCVTLMFYRLFYFMENQALLDPVNESHLFALHFVYLPRINRSLAQFMEGWNSHGIRTEHNKSPVQLFTTGILQLRHSGLVALDFMDDVSDDYGIEYTGVLESTLEVAEIEIPRSSVSLAEQQLQQLRSRVDPLGESSEHGIDLYQEVLDFIGSL